jgi:pimeloyl-ACP methyl ester carboxylesterase
VAFPETLRGARPVEPVSVVIALYGEENSFANWFQGFGQGSAVKEALARHWVFVAARAGRRPEAAIAWLRKAKGLKVGNVFVIGYDMGADVASAFERAGADPSLKLAALAFIAPLPAAEPRALGSVPTYCAVGAQDTVGVSANPFSSESTNGRSDFQIQIFDPCGHGVLVGESIPSVYGFFDRFARR